MKKSSSNNSNNDNSNNNNNGLIVGKESIQVIAQKIGFNNQSSLDEEDDDIFPSLAADVEYRLREIIQEAIKCMRHSKRTILTSDDVDKALHLRNLEPIYGFASGDTKFKKATTDKGLFYIDDKEVEFKHVIEAPISKTPQDTAVVAHWLAVEGLQPSFPQALSSPSDNKIAEYKEDGVPADIKYPLKHVLSRELQLYFEKITELTVARSDSVLFKEALLSLATDSGLHPLVPYFTNFIADEVMRDSKSFHLLFALMRLVRSLLQNPHIHIEPYLHQLMPSIMTCLIGNTLSHNLSNHWELRNFTGILISMISERYGHAYRTLWPRVTKTLLHTFLDPTKTLAQHYGAIRALAAIGSSAVCFIVLPNLELYLQFLEPEMRQKNEVKRYEAWRVYGALLHAVGQYIYNKLKLAPLLLSPPTSSSWKVNAKIRTTIANKHKASTDDMIQQPPTKRAATEGSMGVMTANSFPVNTQRTGVYSTSLGGSDNGLSSISRQISTENVLVVDGRKDDPVKKMSIASTRSWKEVTDAGQLLPLLTECFGESMHAFIPTPLSNIFL